MIEMGTSRELFWPEADESSHQPAAMARGMMSRRSGHRTYRAIRLLTSAERMAMTWASF
jgi:hypothetical protein